MPLQILRIILGFLLTLFIPGFALTLALYPKKKDLQMVERIALSSVLSIAITLLTALFLDLGLGIDFTARNMIISLSLITIVCFFIWVIQTNIIPEMIIGSMEKNSKDVHRTISKIKGWTGKGDFRSATISLLEICNENSGLYKKIVELANRCGEGDFRSFILSLDKLIITKRKQIKALGIHEDLSLESDIKGLKEKRINVNFEQGRVILSYKGAVDNTPSDKD